MIPKAIVKANEPKRIERLTLDKGGEDKSASSGGPMGTRERIVRRAALELKDLPLSDFIAQADGEEAHAVFYFDDGDVYKIRGKGAGRWPTTESVMADLYDISAIDSANG